jgi:hypothetical protein
MIQEENEVPGTLVHLSINHPNPPRPPPIVISPSSSFSPLPLHRSPTAVSMARTMQTTKTSRKEDQDDKDSAGDTITIR